MRAVPTHEDRHSAIRMERTFEPMSIISRMVYSRDGRAMMISTMRIITLSTLPPK